MLRSPRALRLLRRLRRLVLSDNPLLGRQAGAAGAGEAAHADAFLQPGELEWLEARLLQAAPLQLLDLRRTGGCWGWLAGLAHCHMLPLPGPTVEGGGAC